MNIRLLNTENKKDLKTFKTLPSRLYRDNPYWVPPLPGELEFVFNRKLHPFYAHSEADFFVVESETEVFGRIAVLHHKPFCDFHQVNRAFFYYYECVDDQQVSNLLLSAAEDWCKKRKILELYGPRGFLRSNCIGLLVDGFDQPNSTGMTYHQPYYQQQLITNGFLKKSDHFSGIIRSHLDKNIRLVAEKVLAKGHFSIHEFKSAKDLITWIPRLEEVHHRAFAANPDYMPSSTAEFERLCQNIIAIADHRYIKIILYDDKIAGFLVALPNINEGIRSSKGNYYPLGWMNLLISKMTSRVIDLNGVGLLPEFQGLGGNAVLYSEIDRVLSNPRFIKGEVVQVDERNSRSLSDMKTMQVSWNKLHRTFIKSV